MRNGESVGTAAARFVDELRAWRQRHGWSQAELGDKLGYSGSHEHYSKLHAIEKKKSPLAASNASR